VALTNCLPLIDPTDFISQLIISTLLNEPVSADFVNLSTATRRASIVSYANLISYLDKRKTSKPPLHPLPEYEGEYISRAGNFVLSVTPRNEALLVRVQGSQRTTYDLLPHDSDMFYWPADRDEEVCTRFRFPSLWPDAHKFSFGTGSDGVIDHLIWGHDPAAKAEVFWKRSELRKEQLHKL
jgi:Domain of unknown function (DUF3471)